MMTTEEQLSEGAGKDIILRYLVDNPERYFDADNVINDIISSLNRGEAVLLLRRIATTLDEIVDAYGVLNDSVSVKANDLTQRFLDQGGFTQQEQEESQSENLRKEIENLTIKNLKLNNKHLRLKILFGVIGFLAGLITAYFKEILIWFQSIILGS